MANVVRETADTVYATFRRLRAKERAAVIGRLLPDRQFREDLLDIATIERGRTYRSRESVPHAPHRFPRPCLRAG